MALWLCLAAIIVSIALGWKFKFNTGILAMSFAFIIGVFAMGLRVSDIIRLWPTNIVFFLIAISMFFTYATTNGTMDILGKKMLYALNGNAKLIPWVIALVSALVAFLGAGPSTPAIVGPIAFTMGLSAGLHPVLIAVVVGCATLMGADNPINGFGGVISRTLIGTSGFEEQAFEMAMFVWLNSVIHQLIIITIAYIVFKAYKAEKVQVVKPEAFNQVQRKTVGLILVAFVFMVVPPILNSWIKNVDFIRTLAQFSQPQVIMMIAAVLAMGMKLGDEKEIIKKLPMNSILMIAGVAILIGVATAAGLVETMTEFLSTQVPTFMIPGMLIVMAAFLSFFSSGTAVVCPLMYPLVPGLAVSTGLNPIMLFSVIFIGAMSAALSPFSTGGAMVIGGCPDPEVKEKLTNWMIIVASVVIPVIAVIAATIGIFSLFTI